MSEKFTPPQTTADALYKNSRYRATSIDRTSSVPTETDPLSTGTAAIDADKPVEAQPLVDNAGGGGDRGPAVAIENPDEDDSSSSSEEVASGTAAEMPAAMMEQTARVKQLMADAVRMATSIDATVLQEQEIDSEALNNLQSAASTLAGDRGEKIMNEQYARLGAEQWQAQLDKLEAAANEILNKLPENVGIPEEIWQPMGEIQQALDVLEDKNAVIQNNFTDAGGRMDEFQFLVALRHAIDTNNEKAFLHQQLYEHRADADPAQAVSQEMVHFATILKKMEAKVQPEKVDKVEIPADILARATDLGPQLELALKRIENVNPEALRIYGLEPAIKTQIRQMADYYNDPAVADKLRDWSTRDASWDNPRQSLDRWEAAANDIIVKFGLAGEKPEVIGAKMPDGTTLFIDRKKTEPLAENADGADKNENAIPQNILDDARQLSTQAEAVAARCRSLSIEDRQKLKVNLFTIRRFEQLADGYSAENISKELSSAYRESKDWQEVQRQIQGLTENVAKLQLDMDGLGTTAKVEVKSSNAPTGKTESGGEAEAMRRATEKASKIRESVAKIWANEVGKDVPFTKENLAKFMITGNPDMVRAMAALLPIELVEMLKKFGVGADKKGIEAEPAEEDPISTAKTESTTAATPEATDTRTWKPLGESWSPEQKAEFEAWVASGAPKPEGPVLGPEQPKAEAATVPEAQVEQQKNLEQAEKERLEGIERRQQQVAAEIELLWKEIPQKQQNMEAFSWQDVRKYMQARGSLEGYLPQARTEIAQLNERRPSHKTAGEAGMALELLDKLLLERKLLIAEINEKQPGRAGEVMLRGEIEQRAKDPSRSTDMLSVDNGRVQRTDMAEFDGSALRDDGLGWGKNVEVYIKSDTGDTFKLANTKGQWMLEGRADGKAIAIEVAEDDLDKLRLKKGGLWGVKGLPFRTATDFSVRYTGEGSKKVARNYDMLKKMGKATKGQKSLRWEHHDQFLRDPHRPFVARMGGRLKRWSSSD